MASCVFFDQSEIAQSHFAVLRPFLSAFESWPGHFFTRFDCMIRSEYRESINLQDVQKVVGQGCVRSDMESRNKILKTWGSHFWRPLYPYGSGVAGHSFWYWFLATFNAKRIKGGFIQLNNYLIRRQTLQDLQIRPLPAFSVPLILSFLYFHQFFHFHSGRPILITPESQ